MALDFITSGGGAQQPSVQAGLIGIGAGALFLVLGFLVATGYRGLARRFIGLPSDSRRARSRHPAEPRPGTLGDKQFFLRIGGGRHTEDVFIGLSFMALGGLAFVAGLADLLISLIG